MWTGTTLPFSALLSGVLRRRNVINKIFISSNELTHTVMCLAFSNPSRGPNILNLCFRGFPQP